MLPFFAMLTVMARLVVGAWMAFARTPATTPATTIVAFRPRDWPRIGGRTATSPWKWSLFQHAPAARIIGIVRSTGPRTRRSPGWWPFTRTIRMPISMPVTVFRMVIRSGLPLLQNIIISNFMTRLQCGNIRGGIEMYGCLKKERYGMIWRWYCPCNLWRSGYYSVQWCRWRTGLLLLDSSSLRL